MEEEIAFIDNSDPENNMFYQITGRISHRDLWKYLRMYFGYIGIAYYYFHKRSYGPPAVSVLLLVLPILFIRYFMCAAFSKRFHDIDRSAALPLSLYGLEVFLWMVYLYVYFLGSDICLFFFVAGLVVTVGGTLLQLGISYFQPSVPGLNRYGSNPQRDFEEQVREYEQMLGDSEGEAAAKQADE